MKFFNPEYNDFLVVLKQKIRSVQIKAELAVNAEMIRFYWELGKMIAEKETFWGSKFLNNLSTDLNKEFPNLNGFSVSNLKYCRRFYLFYKSSIGQQAVDQIPLGNNILIFTKSQSKEEAYFYLCKEKNNVEAEFALRDINKPMGISEFQLTEILPENLKSSLPSIEEIEAELRNSGNEFL